MEEIKRRRYANAVLRIVHECDAGMKQGVQYYRDAVSRGDTVEATSLIKRAARLPYRVESRVQNLVTKYTLATVNAALALVSNLTISDLQTELAPLKTYSDTLRDAYITGTMTEAQIADDIELNRADIDLDEIAPIPIDYVDDM